MENENPICEKYLLTIREAVSYFHIGEKRMRRIAEENPYAEFLLRNGNRVMIKRKLFEKIVDEVDEV